MSTLTKPQRAYLAELIDTFDQGPQAILGSGAKRVAASLDKLGLAAYLEDDGSNEAGTFDQVVITDEGVAWLRVHGGKLLTAEQRVRLEAVASGLHRWLPRVQRATGEVRDGIRGSMRTPAEVEAKLLELRDRHAAIKPNGGSALAARQNITQAIGALQWVLGEEEQL